MPRVKRTVRHVFHDGAKPLHNGLSQWRPGKRRLKARGNLSKITPDVLAVAREYEDAEKARRKAAKRRRRGAPGTSATDRDGTT